MNFPVARFLRNGLRVLIWLNLPFALVGVTGALLWAPGATSEELVLVIALPLLFFTLGVRISMVVKPQQEAGDDRAAAKALVRVFRAVPALAGLLLALVLILLGFATLVAVPFYIALGIGWAPGFGIIAAALLVIFGVGAFVLAIVMFEPRLFWAMIRSSRRRTQAPLATIRGLFLFR